MALRWWEKGLWQICMHHWTVHGKVDFLKFPPHVSAGGPFHNFWSWTQKCILKYFPIFGGPFHNFSSSTQKWNIYIDIFYGVSYNIKHITAISNLSFQWKIEKINIFKWPSGDGKKFMANLHASLDSTWKSRFSRISTSCQLLGGPFNNLWS